MTEKFLAFLKSYGYPVRLLGYLLDTDEDFDTAILWEEVSTQDAVEADNQSHAIIYEWNVYIIAQDITDTLSLAKKIKKDSLSKPFRMDGLGKGYSIPNTNFYGRRVKFLALERI